MWFTGAGEAARPGVSEILKRSKTGENGKITARVGNGATLI